MLTVSRLNLLTLPPPCFRSDSAVFSTVPRRRYRPTPHLRWPGFRRSQRRLRHLSKRWHRHPTVACRATGARATGARGSSPRFSIHAPAAAGGAHRAAAPTTRKSASSTNVFPSPREPRPGPQKAPRSSSNFIDAVRFFTAAALTSMQPAKADQPGFDRRAWPGRAPRPCA